jgi:uncharacterized protein
MASAAKRSLAFFDRLTPKGAKPMKCPVCSVTLQMMERQGVEIDYCPQCRGVWLDRGELDKLIERSAATLSGPGPSNTPVRREHWDDDDRRGYGQGYSTDKRRKKSFLDDIFDF